MESHTIKPCEFNGKQGYKCGENGKCFTYNQNESSRLNAFDKAVMQRIKLKKQQNNNEWQAAEER
jgi:hypothetical protein